MKRTKKLLTLAAVLCLLVSALPSAWAELPSDERFDGKTWEEIVEDFMTEHGTQRENISMGYRNLVTGEEHFYEGDKYMVAGSMYKVPLNMIYAERISSGEMTAEDTVSGVKYSELQRSSLTYSSNDYAEILWRNLGEYKVFRELIMPYLGISKEQEPATGIYWKNNYFTARQVIHCLDLLYTEADRFPGVIDCMKESEPEKYFRRDEKRFEIAHKYGWINDEVTGQLWMDDCAICYTDEPIAIVLFSLGVDRQYDTLADYCELMCDYAQYTHQTALEEARIAEEKAKAEEASNRQAKEELANALAVAPTGTAIREVMDRVSFSAAPVIPEKSRETEVPGYLYILTGAAVLCAIAAAVIFGRKGRVRTPWAVASALIAGAGILLCLTAAEKGMLICAPEGDPTDAVEGFFDELIAGNYENACAWLADYSSLGLEKEPEDVNARLLYHALRCSYAYELRGECVRAGTQAKQQLALQYLDLTAIGGELSESSPAILEQLVQTLPRDQVYDENNEYLPEIIDTAYSRAIADMLEHIEDYYTAVGLETELTYTDGGWKLHMDDGLLRAVSGGAYGK